jgi:Mycothiol maleylpyruvate isomerase N-terminal domain
MPIDRSFVEQNAHERERLRSLVMRLTDEELDAPVNEHWTVAGVLGHVAFWDGRALFLAGKLANGVPFTASDEEPEDVDWINDANRPLIHAVPPRHLANLALRVAEETDGAVASLPPDLAARTYPADPASPVNAVRASHRAEHLDEIEAALAARGGGEA